MSDHGQLHRLLSSMRRRGARPALTDGEHQLSYEALVARIEDRLSDLKGAGISAGDRVLVSIDQRSIDVVNVLAVVMVGAVAVPYDTSWSNHRCEVVLKDAEPRFRLDGDSLSRTGIHAQSFVENTASTSLLLYTSGSMAEPKGVMVSAAQIEFCVERIGERLGYRSTDTVACPIRLSFDYGLYQAFLAFSAGAKLALCRARNVFGWLRQSIRDLEPTILPLTPGLARVALTKWGDSPGSERVRLITFTGEPVDYQLLSTSKAAFPRAAIQVMYGITECKRVSISEPDEWKADVTSTGRPLRGTTVIIRDPEGHQVGTGVVGEIHVSGPSLTLGYWRSSELTARTFPVRNGVRELATEDLGFVDECGRLHVVGRSGNTYKERGQRVSTIEVEAAASRCMGVIGAICIPPRESASSTLFVQSMAGVTRTELIRGLAEQLGIERIPGRVVLLDELPLTHNGKVDRIALGQMSETYLKVDPR